MLKENFQADAKLAVTDFPPIVEGLVRRIQQHIVLQLCHAPVELETDAHPGRWPAAPHEPPWHAGNGGGHALCSARCLWLSGGTSIMAPPHLQTTQDLSLPESARPVPLIATGSRQSSQRLCL